MNTLSNTVVTTELAAYAHVSHALSSPGGLQGYLNYVNQIPILTAEQEHSLFQQFQEYNDIEAARKLVMAHLRYVAYIAKGYIGYGLPLEDLVQQGNLGLMKSVKRFDLSHGVRLVSFAVHWIKAEIHEYVLKNWRIVKVATTKAQRKLFFNLRKAKKSFSRLTQDEASFVAKQLKVDVNDVTEMESRLYQSDFYFDASYGDSRDDDPTPGLASVQCLEDHSWDPASLVIEDQSNQNLISGLYEGLNKLDERSRDIVQSRWLSEKKLGLKELSERYKVSMERIRQIEARAMERLREVIA